MKVRENMGYNIGETVFVRNVFTKNYDLALILGREWGHWLVYNTETKQEERWTDVYYDEPEINEENEIRKGLANIVDSLFTKYEWKLLSVKQPETSRELREYGKGTKRCIIASKFSNLNISQGGGF